MSVRTWTTAKILSASDVGTSLYEFSAASASDEPLCQLRVVAFDLAQDNRTVFRETFHRYWRDQFELLFLLTFQGSQCADELKSSWQLSKVVVFVGNSPGTAAVLR